MEFYLNSLDSSSIEMLGEATEGVENFLTAFASNESFSTSITLAFGNSINVEAAEDLRQQWSSGNFQGLPRIEIRSAAGINSANGAFASATNTIYLSREFLTQNSTNPEAITNVVLEEIGHYIDSKLNASDTAGDEGAIFSSLVQGETLNEQQLQLLRSEDDSATITLDGRTLEIQQATSLAVAEPPIQVAPTAAINVTYNGFTAQAQTAFQYAVDIWETLIRSPVTINVQANWTALGANILGSAGATNYFRDFSAAVTPNTFYPVALANSRTIGDLDTTKGDINANFSSNFTNWYFGTDGNTLSGQYDLSPSSCMNLVMV